MHHRTQYIYSIGKVFSYYRLPLLLVFGAWIGTHEETLDLSIGVFWISISGHIHEHLAPYGKSIKISNLMLLFKDYSDMRIAKINVDIVIIDMFSLFYDFREDKRHRNEGNSLLLEA
jgi:hypothetical protein